MSVQTQIDRISDAVSAVKAALTEKGVTVPDGTKVDGLAALIAAIESGGGGSTVASGIITPATTTQSITIEHNLGKAPTIFCLWLDKYALRSTYELASVCLHKNGDQSMWYQRASTGKSGSSYVVNQGSDDIGGSYSFVKSNTAMSIVFDLTVNALYFTAGKQYAWACLVEE